MTKEYTDILNYIRDTIHIPSGLIQPVLITSRRLEIDEEIVSDVYLLMEREGLIIAHSEYLYEISPLFPLTTELKEKFRKHQLSETPNRLF